MLGKRSFSQCILPLLLAFTLVASGCMGTAGPATTSMSGGSSSPSSAPSDSRPTASTLGGQDPAAWTCNDATANADTMKSFRGDWGKGHAYARWMVEAGCARDWPDSWKSVAEQKAAADKVAKDSQNAFGQWLMQKGIDQTITVADLSYAKIVGSPLCRNPRKGPAGFDDWGLPIDVTLCGNKQVDASTIMVDITFVGVTTLGTPGFPVDDVLAVGKLGGDIVLFVAAGAGAWLAARGLVVFAARHTDWQHNPNYEGSQARTMIATLLTVWATTVNGGGPDKKCGAVKDAAGKVVRLVIWLADATKAAGGYITSIDPNNPTHPYVTSYEQSQEGFNEGPAVKQLERAARSWDKDFPCPGRLSKLQKAVPAPAQ